MPHRLSQKLTNHESSDHDILLQLVELTKYIADKQADMKQDQDRKLLEIKQNQEITIAKMDARLVALETLVVRNNVEERIRDWNKASDTIQDFERDGRVKEWNESALWVRDFRKSWKLILTILGVVAGVIGWLLQQISTVLGWNN